MNNLKLLKDRNNRIKLSEFIREDLMKLKSGLISTFKLFIKISIFTAIGVGFFLLSFLIIRHISFSVSHKQNLKIAEFVSFFTALLFIVAESFIFIRFTEYFNRLRRQ